MPRVSTVLTGLMPLGRLVSFTLGLETHICCLIQDSFRLFLDCGFHYLLLSFWSFFMKLFFVSTSCSRFSDHRLNLSPDCEGLKVLPMYNFDLCPFHLGWRVIHGMKQNLNPRAGRGISQKDNNAFQNFTLKKF